MLKYCMNLEDWQRLHDRLDQTHRNSLGMTIGSREFWIMHRSVYEKLRLADAEWVNCRRRGSVRGTPKFDQLLVEAEEALKNFEGYVLMAKLMTKEQQ